MGETPEVRRKVNLWIHSLSPDLVSLKDLAYQLQTLSLEIEPYSANHTRGRGILIIPEITLQICEFVQKLTRDGTERIIVLLAGAESPASGDPWRMLQAGASDVLLWDQTVPIAQVIAAKLRRWQEIDDLAQSDTVRNVLVGQSRAWKLVLRRLIEVARFTDDPVVLIGETGTGKELAARLIHLLDLKRNKRDLITLDCTTIVPDLSGSELFGHEKGSFTGAVSARDGAFALADGGTLFLDEIGELSVNLQIQLLRVLQEHTYKRVGSNIWHKVDFRLLCATNQELRTNAELGQFRRDLYYRVAHWVIRMPPLQERSEDIIPLVQYFMKQARPGQELPALDDKVQEYFMTREYPGNVRDLRSLVFRVMACHSGPGPITIGDIPSDERPTETIDGRAARDFGIEESVRRAVSSGLGLREIRKIVEEASIRIAIDNEGGNLQRAARALNVTDRTLQKRRADQLKDLQALANPSSGAAA